METMEVQYVVHLSVVSYCNPTGVTQSDADEGIGVFADSMEAAHDEELPV